jgi:formaldehyde-activating enzyme involved in methanogenesis
MTKQDRANLQAAINAAQEAIDKAVLDARDIIEDEDDEDVVEAMEGLLDELDTQLPAVADYFPDDAKP